MAVKFVKNLMLLTGLGLCLQPASIAAETDNVAKISDANGTIMVDHGKGFISSKVDAPLFENDRVITLEGSTAEIVFSDGCRTKLKSNNLVVINANPGCKALVVDATKAVPGSVLAGINPGSFIPPLAGAGILIGILSVE